MLLEENVGVRVVLIITLVVHSAANYGVATVLEKKTCVFALSAVYVS